MDSLSMFNLAGKRALITGSSRGIGFAIAGALAGAGADVILNSRDPETLGKATADLADSGARARAVAFDVTDAESVADAVGYIEREIGGIDILVNNAGMQHRAPLEDFPEDKFEQILRTNVTSVFLVGQAVARHMIPRASGKIINICSLMVNAARPSIAPYGASKAAVANLTRGMATEWARHGINVNGIAPGYIETNNTEALRADADRSRQILERIPAGRWGSPADLGGAAVYLASPASDYVHGTILAVDGGWLAR